MLRQNLLLLTSTSRVLLQLLLLMISDDASTFKKIFMGTCKLSVSSNHTMARQSGQTEPPKEKQSTCMPEIDYTAAACSSLKLIRKMSAHLPITCNWFIYIVLVSSVITGCANAGINSLILDALPFFHITVSFIYSFVIFIAVRTRPFMNNYLKAMYIHFKALLIFLKAPQYAILENCGIPTSIRCL